MVTIIFRCLVALVRRTLQAPGNAVLSARGALKDVTPSADRRPGGTRTARGTRSARALASKPAALFMILGLLGSMAIVTAAPADAALVRAFTRRFGVKTTGDVVMIANSVLTCPGACTTTQDGTATGAATNNNGVNMIYVDSDGAAASPLAAGGTIATFDSSSSSYTLPAGARVLFAGLYWGGDSSTATGGAAAPNASIRNTVLFRYPGQTGYTPLTSNISGAAGSIDVENGSGNEYHAFNDITALVSANPTGTYTVANLQVGTGQDREGGWAIVFVVEDNTLPARDLTVFDGFASVTSTDPTVTVTITGLQTPPSGIVNTSIGAVAYEGDRNTTGDNMRLNGTTLSNSLNPAANFFNSSRSSLDAGGNPVQIPGTPNHVNNLGFDADIVAANGILGNNATTATVVFNTTGDFFYPGVLTFVTELYAPKLDAAKAGVDINGGVLEPGDVIEYTINVTNNGDDPSTDTILTDAIPVGTIYVPESAQISVGANAGPKTDASGDDQVTYNAGSNELTFRLGTGANATLGGVMAVLATTQVKFRVTVDPAIANGTAIVNRATLSYKGQTIGGGTILSAASNAITSPVALKADLSLTKTHTGNFAAGSTGIYTFTVANAGPNDAAGPITVTDTLPAGMSYVAASATNGWTCTGTPLVCSNPAAIASGGTSSFQISILVGAATPESSVINSAVVASPTIDPVTGNNMANDPTNLTRPVDITVSKTDGVNNAVPGAPLSYTVTVTNNGPLAATGVTVNDTVPAELTGVAWNCSATAGSSCATASGLGNTIATTANLLVGGKATYVINGTLNPSTPGGIGTLVNTATATAPGMTELSPLDNTATDTDNVTPTADIRVTKSDGLNASVPGTPVSYTVTVSNSGPSNVTGVAVADTVPSALTNVSWSCSVVGAALCGSASGTGNTIGTTADLPANTSVSYTVTGTLNPTTPAGLGTLINTATATNPATINDPVPANNSATDTNDVTPRAELVLTKTDGALNAAPGQPITYTLKLTNQGPSTVTGATLTDTIPAAILNPTWTCSATGTGICATPSGTGNVSTLTTLAAGEVATVIVSGTVDPDTPTGIASLVNTATATLPIGVVDPTPGPTTATDTNDITPIADLALTKTDGLSAAVPGSPVTYTVVVTNAGPSTATAALLTDTVPSAITGVTWTCTANGAGAACSAASGSGNVISLPVTVRPGSNVTLTISGTLNPTTAAGIGSLTNTANVAPPAGTNDPSLLNNQASDTNDVTPIVDLAVVKTRTAGVTEPGAPIGYTVTVTNAGPSTATAAVLADVVPAAITGVTWTCTVTGAGASCSAPSGSGNGISLPVTLPMGTSATLNISGTVAASTPGGPLANTATITPAPGATDASPGNDSSTASSVVASYADVRMAKTRTGAAVPGSTLTYLVTATNDGPSPVLGASVTDVIPAILLGATWSCVGTASGVCPGSGTGSINAAVDLPVGASVTFTVVGTIDPAATGTLSNTATITPPASITDPAPLNNSATDDGALTPSGDLGITKTNGVIASAPGTATSYTIRVTNTGPSTATNAAVVDTLPGALTNVAWTCSATVGSSCAAASGTNTLNTAVTLASGGVATYLVNATIDANATGTLANTVRVTPPALFTDVDSSNEVATDTDTLGRIADVSITKTDGASTAVPGTPIQYTIVASNAGPSSATADVTDAFSAALTGATWTCSATTGSSCLAGTGSGAIATKVTLLANGKATFLIDALIAPSATGDLVNAASIVSEAGTLDPDSSNDSATDTNTLTPVADLVSTKTNGSTTLVSGMPTTYTITVTNKGPSRATSVRVVDALPASLLNAAWNCTATPSSTCNNASGLGSVNTTVDLAPNGVATFVVNATVDPATPAGPLVNTVVATNAPGTTDPTPLDATARDTDTVTPQVDLTTVKTDGALTIVPGTSATYTITVSNNGPSTAVGTTITDSIPVALTGAVWNCAASTGSTCSAASGTGNVAITADIAAAGKVVIVVTAFLDPTTPAGTLTNTATATVATGTTDTNPLDNIGQDTNTVIPTTELHVTKTNGAAAVVPGTNTTYVITVVNDGPSALIGAALTDNVPFALTNVSWTCSASTGSLCPAANGLGNINETITLPASGTLTYLVTGSVPSTATGTLANTAAVQLPVGTVDPTPLDVTATDSDPLTPTAEIVLNKIAPTGPAISGLPLTYTITASNTGPSFAAGITVADAPPAALLNPTWTCSATAGSSCPTANGTGGFSQAVDIAVGGTVTFLLTATVDPGASGDIINTATVTYPPTLLDPTPGPTTATDTRKVGRAADLAITKTDRSAEAVPGDAISYTIVVENKGPSNVVGAAIVDNVPAYLTGVAWTCAADTGAACSAASGTGNVGIIGDFQPNTKLTITLTGTINPAAVGTLTNTASVTPPADVFDLDPTTNTATDTSVLVPTVKLAATKTDGAASSVPGGNITYTVTVTNTGLSAAINTAVIDRLPAGLTNATWTCSVTPAAAPSACGSGAGVGSIVSTVSLAPNATATYLMRARIDAQTRGAITNNVSVTAANGTRELDLTDNAASDTNSLTPVANLRLTKTNASVAVIPGTSTTYTITVSNAGPSSAIGAQIIDTVPTILTGVNWTCVASTGSFCGSTGDTGDIVDTVTVAPLGVLTYIVSGTVPNDATGRIVNTATVTTAADTTDPDGTNNTATDDDPLTPTAEILLTKTAPAGPALAGLPITYTITATNQGPSFAAGITVNDAPPATLTNPTWTCEAAAGSSCDAAAGTGVLNEVVNLAPGGSVTYLYTADLDANASGTLANTASVTYPSTLLDPTPGSTTATDSRRIAAAADLVITKTDNATEVVPGKATTYTITLLNKGPAKVNGASIADVLPAALKNTRWDCGASSGAVCSILTGTGDINLKADLAPLSSVTITLVADVDPTASAGDLINDATVEIPADVIDPDPLSNSSRDRSALTPLVNLSATKTDNTDSVMAGTETTYVITVTNSGISTAVNASVVDALPAYLTGATWTCAIDVLPAPAAAVSSCLAATGIGSIDTKVTLASGAKAIYTVKATVDPAARGTLTNTVKLTPVAGAVDTDPSDNEATDTNTVTASADLTVTKTDGVTEIAPGAVGTYVITLSNAGPSTATSVLALDPNLAGITESTWTCTATAPSVCPRSSGSGSINESGVVVAPGGSVVYRVLAKIDPAARGTVTNTVSVSAQENDPNPSNNNATDINALVPVADLSVTKTDGKATLTPGRGITYTIVATNAGPSSVTKAIVSDELPKGLSNATWTCKASTGAACAVASGAGSLSVPVDLAPGAQVTITLETKADTNAGDITNTAKIAAPADTRDPDLTNNSSDDANTAAPEVDLVISKTDNQETATPGKKISYTIEVINQGPSFARAARVSDLLPAELLNATWDCMGTCSGLTSTGNVDATIDLDVNDKAVITVTGMISPDAVGELRNEASATSAGAVDTNPGNNTAVDVTKLVPESDVAVTKTDGIDEVVAGDKTEYTITVTNKGPSSAKAIAVADKLPEGLIGAQWSCAVTEQSVCLAPTGSGSIATTVDLKPDGVATFVVKATVDPNIDPNKGDLTNTVTATVAEGSNDPDSANNSAADADKIIIKADVKITKTHTGVVTAGKPVAYTVTVSNDGPSGVRGAKVVDTLPVYLTGATWTCSAVAPTAKCGLGSENGNIDTTIDLAPKASATFTLTAMVDVDAPDEVENTATIELMGGAIDTDPASNTATDRAKNLREADISITKDDGTKHAVQGRQNEYEIVVSNTGPSSGMGVLVNDLVPKGLSDVSWTCEASEGSACSVASGQGAIEDVSVNVRPNGKVTFLLSGTVSKTQMSDLINTATATPPSSLKDPDLKNNSATDRDVMWKEWLKNPPKKKTKGIKIEKSQPSIGDSATEAIEAVLAFTGSDARSMALTGLFLSLGGFATMRAAAGKRRRRKDAPAE